MKNKLFYINRNNTYISFCLFGIVFKSRQVHRWLKIREQNKNFAKLEKKQELIVFFIPGQECINGGVLSIFNLCKFTKIVKPNALTILCTYPGKITYLHNSFFENDEQIYRWEQIVRAAKKTKRTLIHIPEYYAELFYDDLCKKDQKILQKLSNLHVNILNQNMTFMPSREKIQTLYKLTCNLTQTLAFKKNLTQKLADDYQMPVHLFSTYLDYSKYKATEFDKKEKIIVLSPDSNSNKENIVDSLKAELPDFKLIIVQNLKFNDYMDLISRAFAVITFGEGFDWYFMQPPQVGTLSFSVYNDTFFPNKTWLNLDTVFSSYEELGSNIVQIIKKTESCSDLYYQLIEKTKTEINKVYSKSSFLDNLNRFYQKRYDILPHRRINEI